MDEDHPRTLLGFAFWLALALAFACICAGSLIAVFGPRLFPPHVAAQAASPDALGKPPTHR